jgi:hypothetical protein
VSLGLLALGLLLWGLLLLLPPLQLLLQGAEV